MHKYVKTMLQHKNDEEVNFRHGSTYSNVTIAMVTCTQLSIHKIIGKTNVRI